MVWLVATSTVQIWLIKNFYPIPLEEAGGRGQGSRGAEILASPQSPIPNPQSPVPNPRLYKTGDLAQYLPDGNIEFLGRIDDLVKIRGFRVELGEVEAVLSKHPQINQAVAKVHGESAREKYLVAYFVPIPGETITVEQLRTFLTNQLPDYMIPSAFIEMESFPLTPNGKVNRRALPEPTTNRPELGPNFCWTAYSHRRNFGWDLERCFRVRTSWHLW